MTNAVVDLKPSKNQRVYVIGDIHGCYDELLSLESKIYRGVSPTRSKAVKIISVGDLCDRGPDTAKVMEHFARGDEAGTHLCVLGNHETFFLLALAGLRPDLVRKAEVSLAWYHDVLTRIFPHLMTKTESWRQNGGATVFASYEADMGDPSSWDKIPLSHIRLLFKSPLVVRTPTAVISHALLEPGDIECLELGDQAGLPAPKSKAWLMSRGSDSDFDRQIQDAIIRCLWSRTAPTKRVDPSRRHISGHTPLDAVKRELSRGTIQIDTGAVYGRTLTSLNLSGFRTMAVPAQTRK